MKFELVKKDYQREIYEAPFTWIKGISLKAQVKMQYHTFLHYWDVGYRFLYGTHFGYATPYIKGKDNITGKNARKTARKFAKKLMDDASPVDVGQLKEFFKSSIQSQSGVIT